MRASVCVFLFVCVCVGVCMYIHTNIHIYMYMLHVHTHTHTRANTHIKRIVKVSPLVHTRQARRYEPTGCSYHIYDLVHDVGGRGVAGAPRLDGGIHVRHAEGRLLATGAGTMWYVGGERWRERSERGICEGRFIHTCSEREIACKVASGTTAENRTCPENREGAIRKSIVANSHESRVVG